MKLNYVYTTKIIAVLISVGMLMPNPAFAFRELATAKSEVRLDVASNLNPAFARSENRNTPFMSDLVSELERLLANRGGQASFRAFPKRFVDKVKLWVSTRMLSKPAEPRAFNGVTFPKQVDKSTLRTQDQMLAMVQEKRPRVVGMQRFADVGGSSIDLRALIKLATKIDVNALDLLPSTTVVAGSFPLELDVEIASDYGEFNYKDVIEYNINYKDKGDGKIVDKTKTYRVVRKDGKMFTVMEDGSLRDFIADKDGEYEIWGESGKSRKQFRKAGQVIDGQIGAFAYFMSQVNAFGIRGNFVTREPVAEAGGLGRSGGSNAMFIAMASMLSGAKLTKADMQAEAVEKEGNGEDDKLAILGGYTGGQESGATLEGTIAQFIHLTEVMDAAGNYVWPVGTELIRPLFGSLEEANQKVLSRLGLVQPGVEYINGVPQVKRTAGGINTTWCARAKQYGKDIDEEGRALHMMKVLVAHLASYGLENDDWDLVLWSQNAHRRIRAEIDKGFYRYAVMALDNIPDRPSFCDKYLEILRNDPILSKYLQFHIDGRDDQGRPFDLRNVSLYQMTQEPLIDAVTEIVREMAGRPDLELGDPDSLAAVFVPGAGGTGSPAVLLAKTPEIFQEIMQKLKLKGLDGLLHPVKAFDPGQVVEVMHGTGLLQGVIQPKVGKAIEIENLGDEEKPQEGIEGFYDQDSGFFYITGDTSKIDPDILKLPRVRLLSDHPEIQTAYQDQVTTSGSARSESRNPVADVEGLKSVIDEAVPASPVDLKAVFGQASPYAARSESRVSVVGFNEPLIADATFVREALPLLPVVAGGNPVVAIVKSRSEARMIEDFNTLQLAPAGMPAIMVAYNLDEGLAMMREAIARQVRRGLMRTNVKIRAIVTATSTEIAKLKQMIGDSWVFIATKGWISQIAAQTGLTTILQKFAAMMAVGKSA